MAKKKRKRQTIEGTLQKHKRGFGFVSTEDGEKISSFPEAE